MSGLMASSVIDLLKYMNESGIVFAYTGKIDDGLLEAIYAMMEDHLDKEQVSVIRKKKFFQILVESLQNILHHQEGTLPLEKEHGRLTGMIIFKNNDSYNLTTVNPIEKSHIPALKGKLDKVNEMNADELKEYYRQTLAKGEFSEKGGAGLGIIEIARKSGRALKYEFNDINADYALFNLTIQIP
jgi:hypothetical protein